MYYHLFFAKLNFAYLYYQEVREKDQQLVHFQQELVQLVTALRHWKERASDAEGGSKLGAEISSAFPLFV